MMLSRLHDQMRGNRLAICAFEFLKTARDEGVALLFYLFRVFPMKKNKVVIDSYGGRGFGDNGKYIAKELLKRGGDIDIVWLCSDLTEPMPDGIRKVSFFSVRSIYEQVTAKLWIDNRRKPGYVRKRKNQIYIHTWHAGIALKRIEKDAVGALSNYYVKCAKRDSAMIDYLLSDSRWTTELYRNVFWYDGPILESGLPRQDVLVNPEAGLKEKVKEALGIPDDSRVILYAPTFRDGHVDDPLQFYRLDWSMVLKAFSERFGGKWTGVMRLHPNIARLSKDLARHRSVVDGTNYPDMQELLVASDCVITDYSSTIIDYCPTGNLGFIFATDIDEYQKSRNFYFDIRELPFPIGETNQELKEKILSFDAEKYQKDIYEFYHDKCGLYPVGSASETVCDLIFSNI